MPAKTAEERIGGLFSMHCLIPKGTSKETLAPLLEKNKIEGCWISEQAFRNLGAHFVATGTQEELKINVQISTSDAELVCQKFVRNALATNAQGVLREALNDACLADPPQDRVEVTYELLMTIVMEQQPYTHVYLDQQDIPWDQRPAIRIWIPIDLVKRVIARATTQVPCTV